MASLIYFQSEASGDEVAEGLAEMLGIQRDPGVASWTIESPAFYISIRRNQLADVHPVWRFPDGFLNFAAYVEFSESDDVPEEETAESIGKILRYFWDRGIPAVAESNLDEALPFGGGYGRRELPWPRAPEQAGAEGAEGAE